MKVTVICSDPRHPVHAALLAWQREMSARAEVRIVQNITDARGGDFLFLVSCQDIVRKPVRDAYRYCLVLHASDLPRGRGMSPHIWRIIEGARSLTITLLSAEDAVDTGAIWRQQTFEVAPTDLADEINARLFAAEMELMTWALVHCDTCSPSPQHGEPSYYRRRSAADSQIDVHKPLAEAFDLLRIADPERFPAFFEYRGQKYRIRIDKL